VKTRNSRTSRHNKHRRLIRNTKRSRAPFKWDESGSLANSVPGKKKWGVVKAREMHFGHQKTLALVYFSKQVKVFFVPSDITKICIVTNPMISVILELKK
jgi:hypothetical protein